MCGICGLFKRSGEAVDPDVLVAMRDVMRHRGPDDVGQFVEGPVGLGFRRLSIIDLATGNQPIRNEDGTVVLVFNGEIYNYKPLRKELRDAGHHFSSETDSEVIVHAYEQFGDRFVEKLNGMFAIAVWDGDRRRLQLIRDRMGVKPLYYGLASSTFLFGSELKALRQHPDFEGRIDEGALHLYLRLQYVPAPYSIYAGVRKVMPGTIVTFEPSTRRIETTAWWSLPDVVRRCTSARFDGAEEEASQELERLLRDSIRLRMVADVPTGVFLSGGVDSSAVAALMQSESGSPVKSFTVGFDDPSYDEAPVARAIAHHLGTDHRELYVSDGDIAAVVPALPSIYDEPFADPSQVARVLVSRFARREVVVCLTGEGGDELFGGYDRYASLGRIPPRLRSPLARLLSSLPPHVWDRIIALGKPLLPAVLRQPRSGARIHKLARILTGKNLDTAYFELAGNWSHLASGRSYELPAGAHEIQATVADVVEQMMLLDQMSSLHDGILTKVDRASMAASLEAREPLLDYRVVEFSWRLPLRMKVHGGAGKHVLREVLARHVPRSLTDRPKMGFGIPFGRLLRGRLRDWAESLLDPATLRAQGLLEVEPSREKWNEHLAGRQNWKYHLWGVLMLQAWLQQKA